MVSRAEWPCARGFRMHGDQGERTDAAAGDAGIRALDCDAADTLACRDVRDDGCVHRRVLAGACTLQESERQPDAVLVLLRLRADPRQVAHQSRLLGSSWWRTYLLSRADA